MKNILYILFFISFVFTGCVKDQDDIFDLPSAQRAEQLNKDCKATLVAAPNGWVMEYYPSTQYYGGSFIYMTFTQDSVRMTDEAKLDLTPVSFYSLKLDNGPVLSFDTYNEVIHKYADPGQDGIGYGGDYEFIIVSVSPDVIMLTGKKGFDKIVMRPLAQGKTFAQYLDEVKSMDSYLNMNPQWRLIDGNDTLYISGDDKRHFMTSVDPAFVNDVVANAALPTQDGIIFNPALELNGKSYSIFKFSDDKTSLISTDSKLTGKIVGETPQENFLTMMAKGKTWNMLSGEGNMSDKVREFYTLLENGCSDKGRKLSNVGFSFKDNNYLLRIGSKKGSTEAKGEFYYDVTSGDNTVSYKYLDKSDTNGANYLKTFSGFNEFVNFVTGSYTLSTTDYLMVKNIRMTSKSDASVWFDISLN